MNIPDSIRSKGGFKVQRDNRDTNVRYDCCYCPRQGLLHTSYGLHIVKEHLNDVFDTTIEEGKGNREYLYKKSALDEPFLISHKDNELYCCFGCYSLFKCGTKAVNHFKKKPACAQKHRDNLLTIRDSYPKDVETPQKAGIKHKGHLELLIEDMLKTIRSFEHKYKVEETFDYAQYNKYHEGWGLLIDEERMKAFWEPFEEPKEPEVKPVEIPEVKEITPLPQNNDDILPLVVPKPPTQLQMLEELLKDPELDEVAKVVLKKEVVPMAPKVEVKEEIKKTPWEELYYGNPDTPIAELIMIAAKRGITPDPRSNIGIVGNTKVKRNASIRK